MEKLKKYSKERGNTTQLALSFFESINCGLVQSAIARLKSI